jgi:hypothetical protein
VDICFFLNLKEDAMKKEGTQHHKKAKHHMEKAAQHHEKAAQHMEKIKHEKKEKKLIGKLGKMHEKY